MSNEWWVFAAFQQSSVVGLPNGEVSGELCRQWQIESGLVGGTNMYIRKSLANRGGYVPEDLRPYSKWGLRATVAAATLVKAKVARFFTKHK